VQLQLGTRARQLLDLSITMNGLGALMSYLNIIGKLGSMVFQSSGGGSWILSYAGCIAFWATLIDLPILLAARRYAQISFVSLGSSVTMLGLVLFVAIMGHEQSNGTVHAPPLWPTGARCDL